MDSAIRSIVATKLEPTLDNNAKVLAKLQAMSNTSEIDSVDLLAFALPLLKMEVPKVRIAQRYSERVGFRVTRQALDYHLEKRFGKSKAPINGPDRPGGSDQPAEQVESNHNDSTSVCSAMTTSGDKAS